MKNQITAIKTITITTIMLAVAYLLGTMQAETITEIQTVTVIETREIIPAGYIPLNDDIVDMDTVVGFSVTEYGLELYFADGSGFWLETD